MGEREGFLRLFCTSFQFIKDNLNAIRSQQSLCIYFNNKEHIQPYVQPSQEKVDFCSYIQRKIKMPPFLTEEEIDQLINMQSTSAYFSPNLNYHIA